MNSILNVVYLQGNVKAGDLGSKINGRRRDLLFLLVVQGLAKKDGDVKLDVIRLFFDVGDCRLCGQHGHRHYGIFAQQFQIVFEGFFQEFDLGFELVDFIAKVIDFGLEILFKLIDNTLDDEYQDSAHFLKYLLHIDLIGRGKFNPGINVGRIGYVYTGLILNTLFSQKLHADFLKVLKFDNICVDIILGRFDSQVFSSSDQEYCYCYSFWFICLIFLTGHFLSPIPIPILIT